MVMLDDEGCAAQAADITRSAMGCEDIRLLFTVFTVSVSISVSVSVSVFIIPYIQHILARARSRLLTRIAVPHPESVLFSSLSASSQRPTR